MRGMPALALLMFACTKDDDTDGSSFGLDERPANETCVAFDRQTSVSGYDLDRSFSELSFDLPIAMVQIPGDDTQWFVAEQSGIIRRFANAEETDSSTEALDIRDRVYADASETGLLGMAFHPDFANSPYIYLNYTADEGQLETRISRFTVDSNGDIDPDSEVLLLHFDQPFENHNGGQVAFGPDGFLYIGAGDGGLYGDPLGAGQDTELLLAKILRIDVDNGSPYAIPADNPFADGDGGAPEVYAWGLRNPWRFSFDTADGTLWVADVGQDAWEEIDRVELGGNYGWNEKEGTHCYLDDDCDDPAYIDPVAEYSHDEGYSVTGGFVWHSDRIPSLDGSYLYADFGTGHFWRIDGSENVEKIIDSSGLNVSTFAQGADGEVYALDYGTGRIYHFVEGDVVENEAFPTLLSQTGCVDPNDPTKLTSGLIPYDINAPFWSDGAEKDRWFAIPDGSTIEIDEAGDWVLPVGSVVMKTFHLNDRLFETRLLVRHDDGGWAGYSYAWNSDGTDAEYVDGGRVEEVEGQTWTFPSTGQCATCHTQVAGRTLGLENAQMNKTFAYSGGSSNQVATLEHIGMFDADPGSPSDLPALSDPHGDDPVEDRARAWLHSNCSQCHRSGGTGGGTADYRYGLTLAEMGICDVAPAGGGMEIEDPLLFAPGEPDRSVIPARMAATDEWRMPPLGSAIADEDGVALIREWITSTESCD